MSIELEFAGRKVNLGPALPLKLGDWRRLEQKGVTPAKLESGSVEALATITHYILNKADATITQEQVDAEFTILDERLIQLVKHLHKMEAEETDLPT